MTKREIARRKQLSDFLDAENTLTLATVADDGTPHACSLFYVLREPLLLYWVSSRSSLHSVHIGAAKKVSVCVQHATSRWQEIRGVQMQGYARVVEDAELRKLVHGQYAKRFSLGAFLKLALGKSTLYEFRPEWLRYIDNSKHFGYKFETVLPAESEEKRSKGGTETA